jgi:hypothetical protein
MSPAFGLCPAFSLGNFRADPGQQEDPLPEWAVEANQRKLPPRLSFSTRAVPERHLRFEGSGDGYSDFEMLAGSE